MPSCVFESVIIQHCDLNSLSDLFKYGEFHRGLETGPLASIFLIVPA
jgi:hypothetical protein